MTTFLEKSQGHAGGAARKLIGRKLVRLPRGVEQATPDEIVEAKMDGVCPRCDHNGDFFADGGLCNRCGFSY